MKDSLEDNEILHSGEGGDVERWLEPRNKFFVFVIACVLLSIVFHFFYACVIINLAFYDCFHSIAFFIGLYSSQQESN